MNEMFENIKNIAPAILYRDQIHTEFTKRMYTKEMHLLSGRIGSIWIPDIEVDQHNWKFQFAIVDDDRNLIGYISFCVIDNKKAFSSWICKETEFDLIGR